MLDVVIIGAGVAGSALAARLGQLGRRVVLIERDPRPPQLFVGELLQPGGVAALQAMGLRHCLDDIDAQPTRGFAVFSGGETLALDYPGPGDGGDPPRGYAFHHGRFVQQLRDAARGTPGVTLQQGTATGLLEERQRVRGVVYRDDKGEDRLLRARLVVAADGRNSRLRQHMGGGQPERLSYSVGLLLRDVQLPSPGHGNVLAIKPAPLLCYRISTEEVRVLVDIPGDLPSTRNGALAARLNVDVASQLPDPLRDALRQAVATQRLRAMPNYALTPTVTPRPGAAVLGDALDMRHPVTGGGMTVALHDAHLLAQVLDDDLWSGDDAQIDLRVVRFYAERRPLAMTIDMLAGALYRVLRADGPGLERMREAMLRYWQLGGPAADGPMALLSGVSPRPGLLALHYTAVALLGVGSNLAPRQWSPGGVLPDLKGASQLVAAALTTAAPAVRRALTR